jgi:integrase
MERVTGDLSAWTISAQRAKNGVAHIVPLSPQAQVILRAAPRYEGTDPIFPGRRGLSVVSALGTV